MRANGHGSSAKGEKLAGSMFNGGRGGASSAASSPEAGGSRDDKAKSEPVFCSILDFPSTDEASRLLPSFKKSHSP